MFQTPPYFQSYTFSEGRVSEAHRPTKKSDFVSGIDKHEEGQVVLNRVKLFSKFFVLSIFICTQELHMLIANCKHVNAAV
jgi:hypothetical protein